MVKVNKSSDRINCHCISSATGPQNDLVRLIKKLFNQNSNQQSCCKPNKLFKFTLRQLLPPNPNMQFSEIIIQYIESTIFIPVCTYATEMACGYCCKIRITHIG